MTTAASGCVSLAAENMRTTLSQSDTFQTLVGADDATEALASIYHWELPRPTGARFTLAELQALRPYALIATRGYNAPPAGVQAFSENGTFEIEFIRDIAEADWDDEAEILVTWMNIIGGIMDDLKALSETDGCLIMGEISLDPDGPWRNHQDFWPTQGRIQGCSIMVDWGRA